VHNPLPLFCRSRPADIKNSSTNGGSGYGDPRKVRLIETEVCPSPQSGNLSVDPQLPLYIVTAGPEDDASGAAGLELDETFAQLLGSTFTLSGSAVYLE